MGDPLDADAKSGSKIERGDVFDFESEGLPLRRLKILSRPRLPSDYAVLPLAAEWEPMRLRERKRDGDSDLCTGRWEVRTVVVVQEGADESRGRGRRVFYSSQRAGRSAEDDHIRRLPAL